MNFYKMTKAELIAELEKSVGETASLRTELRECAQLKDRCEFKLRERVKELRLQNQMSDLFVDRSLSLDEIALTLVNQIPPAWQYPEQTGALIKYRDKVFQTSNYSSGSPLLNEKISAGDQDLGFVSICYLGEKPEGDSSIFLAEEYDLLRSVASRFGNIASLLEQRIALQKSESMYQSMIAASPDVITITDLEGKIQFSSEKAVAMFGSESADKFVGRHILDFIDESGHEKAISEMTKMASGQLAGAAEYIGVRSDGSRFDIEVNGEFIRDENGQPVQMIFITRDVTERTASSNSLKESERRFRQLFENMAQGVIYYDSKGRIIQANTAAERILGITIDQMLGNTSFNSRWRMVNEDETPFDFENSPAMVALKTGNEVTNTVIGVFHPDQNEFFYLLINAVPEFLPGESMPFQVFTTFTDITGLKNAGQELKRSEEKYKSLFNNSPDGYLIFQDGIFVECNKASESLIGGTRADLIGKRPDEISPELQPNGKRSFDYVIEVVNEAFASGKNEFEWIHKKVDGTEFLALIHLAPVEYENREALLVSWKDITSLRAAEQAIRQSEEKYRLIFETIRDVYYEADLSGIIQEVSPSVRFLTRGQYTREDLIGTSLYDHYAISTERDEFLKKLREKGSVDDYEVLLKNRDGSIIPISLSTGFLYDNEGRPMKIAGSVRDITERQKALEELTKFRTITDKANYGVAIADLNGSIMYVNPYWASSHGFEAHELTGENLMVFHSGDQLEVVAGSIRMLMEKGEFEALEIGHTRKDGSTFPALMSAIVVTSNGQPIYMSATAIDITDLKLAEAATRINEEKLNYAQEIAKMGSWDMDAITGETSWSKNYYKLIERSSDDFRPSYENFMKIVHPQDHKLVKEGFEEIRTKREAKSIDMRLLMPDGRIKWITNHIMPEFDGTKLVALHGANIDISSKKVQDNEINRLRLAIEQSPVAVVLTDLNAVIQYINPAFTTITGYREDEAIGQNVRILKSGKTDPMIYKELWDTIKSGKTWLGEWVNRKKDGSHYWESISITPIQDENNEITSYLAIKQDITERKQSEQAILEMNTTLEKKVTERTSELAESNKELIGEIEERKKIQTELQEKTIELEQFFQVTLDLLCIADTSGNFIKVNKAWEEILGYNASELEKSQFLEFIHPEDIQLTLDAMKTLDEQNPVLKFTNRYRTRRGDYRFIEWHSVPVGSRIYAAARDVTDRMHKEVEITNARKEAEEANTAKSEFLSRMSHELRTPMNSILGFAQLLERSELNPSQKKGVNHILHSGKHLLGLINEVLDISRIEAGRISFSPEPVQLKGVIAEMIDITQPQATARNIKISFTDSEAIHMYVKSDRQRLKQILLNLISNGIKYNRNGGSVSISAELRSDYGSDFIRISVRDTGVGISQIDIPKLFIPFERIGAENTETEGTGLGLTVVKKLVDLMGGHFGVESTEGEGSTFWIELPRVDSQLEQFRQGTSGIDLHHSGKPFSGTILYVEDNRSNIDLVQDILDNTRPGIKLMTTMQGRQAFKMASDYKPDLILLDLNLPDIHGSEVLRELKSCDSTKDIPVIIITADALPSRLKPLLEQGAREYLTKPLELDQFLEVLDSIFKKTK